MAYVDMSSWVRSWENLEAALNEPDRHHVWPTTRDYTDIDDNGYLEGHPETQLYQVNYLDKKFEVHLGAVKAMCKALGWQLDRQWYVTHLRNMKILCSGEDYANILASRMRVNEALNSNPQMSRGKRDRLRVLTNLLEVECIVGVVITN